MPNADAEVKQKIEDSFGIREAKGNRKSISEPESPAGQSRLSFHLSFLCTLHIIVLEHGEVTVYLNAKRLSTSPPSSTLGSSSAASTPRSGLGRLVHVFLKPITPSLAR